MNKFCTKGKADVVLGGQYGSEAKGAAVAWLADQLQQGNGNVRSATQYGIVTTNASSQAGHTCVHMGKKYVTRHFPTAPLIAPGSIAYLNAGCAIDPDVFEQEMKDLQYVERVRQLVIHPNAAVITNGDKMAEARKDSAQTKISSTQKGVGQAISRKVQRVAMTAKDHPLLSKWCGVIDLNRELSYGDTSVLVEVPQGYSLSLNGPFYPYCTSRDCTVMQGLSDAHIHPSFLGSVMLVLRTYPIRVGSLPGQSSGDVYPDQKETSWAELGLPEEKTTVTGRVRRVFTWSHMQVCEAMSASRPDLVYLSHGDYVKNNDIDPFAASIYGACAGAGMNDPPVLIVGRGPTTADARRWPMGAEA